ncbi:MAG: DNA primase [Candidatus Staskawiczbacteria bacterium]|jgi:DNA primase
MDSQIEEIKSKLNVLDVVGSYVKLSKTGINYRGICPFHSEKGPSFFVSPGRQMWKCFGCGKGGDIFEFIKEIEGIEFGDALRLLANKAGVELKRENPQATSERKRLYEICDLACSFFEKQLEGSGYGKEAKEYLLKRGIIEESIKKWRLGYSPDTWQGLSDFLVGRGYNRQEIVKAGLAVPSDKGNNPYDRFRGRIIFPIFDLNSQVVGFTARVFSPFGRSPVGGKDAVIAKYINTPQTLLYDKSNVLYGLNFAKLAIRKNNQCVLTEGNTDAIMCQQAGFENTVAVSGTALTERHLNILKRYTDNLVLAFDMDSAGDTATKRGIDLAIFQGFNIKVIHSYLGAKDPAEIILENPKIWEESLKTIVEIMDFSFNSALLKFDKDTSQGRKEIKYALYPRINIIPNIIEQAKQFQKLSQIFNVKEEDVRADFNDWKKNNQSNDKLTNKAGLEKILPINKNNFTAEGRKKLLEDKIVSLVLKNPENLDLIEESHHCLFCDETKNLINSIKASAQQRGNDPEAIFADISSSVGKAKNEYKNVLDELALKAEVEYGEDNSEEIQLCLSLLKDIELRNNLSNLFGEVKLEDNEQKRDELIKEFTKQAKELHKKI